MNRIPKCCLLLLLLACDWAGDPYHGHSALSVALGNQPVCCPSIWACREAPGSPNYPGSFGPACLAPALIGQPLVAALFPEITLTNRHAPAPSLLPVPLRC